MNRPVSEPRMGRQYGGALVVGLVLLAVLTILGMAGMKSSTLELAMAGNKQFSEDAFQAAETGIDRALRAASFNTGIADVAPRAVVSPEVKSTVESRTEFFRKTRVPQGGFSLGENGFEAYHFQVTSTGASARNATSTHRQRFYVVGPEG